MNKWTQRLLLAICIVNITGAGVAAGSSVRSPEITLDHGAQDPSLCPHGSQIAVSILGKIWLVPAHGGDALQLTRGFGWDTHPAWSPDGRFLAYSHQVSAETDLLVYNLATRSDSFLTRTAGKIGPIEYAPDGSSLFYVLRQGDAHIQEISVSGGKVTEITETEGWNEWDFAISPDGKDLLTSSGRYGGSNLYRIRLKDRMPTRLTHTEADQRQVAWTRDGRDSVYVETLNGAETIFAQPLAGGERRAIYSSPYRDMMPTPLFPKAVPMAGQFPSGK